ncbi:hypothetical protein EYF80_014718 [Liparis tanakae]|uniref:Uncharacterized protein n=1 Tax=Liparis tanakae TaxID=230148 RepID=A0A4Z2ID07_9TELE|nr:hypothetical protein EYF80_014718 [Liparis tanakae]
MLLLYADYKEGALYEKNIYSGPRCFRTAVLSERSGGPRVSPGMVRDSGLLFRQDEVSSAPHAASLDFRLGRSSLPFPVRSPLSSFVSRFVDNPARSSKMGSEQRAAP